MTPISPEFILVAVACGVGCAVGTWKAARHKARVVEYAFLVREYEPDEGTIMDGAAAFEQLTFDQALEKRNAVLDDVADRNASWLRQAAAEMARIADGAEGTGEHFRKVLLDRGVPAPQRPHAWGALINTMTKRGVLVRTGERRPMLDPKAHGRSTDVYVKRTPAEIAA